MVSLGDYLKTARLNRGLSLKDVQEKTGIKDSRLSRIEKESNKTETNPSLLKVLAELYEISVIELYFIAGYLDKEILSDYQSFFKNVDLLNDEEKAHVQNLIDLFTKGRKHDDF